MQAGMPVPSNRFAGIAEDVVAVGAVLREIERLVLEDGDEIGEPLDHFPAAAELRGVVEIGQVGELVGIGQRGDDALVDLVADVGAAFQRDHVGKARAGGNGDGCEGHAREFVADVFDEEEDEDVILVLARIHAAAQFVARRPDRGVEV